MRYKVVLAGMLVLAAAAPVAAIVAGIALSAYSVAPGANVDAGLQSLSSIYDLWLCEEGGSDHFLLAEDVDSATPVYTVTVTIPYAAPVGQYRVMAFSVGETCGDVIEGQSELLSVGMGAPDPTATPAPTATATATPVVTATATLTPTVTPAPTAVLSYGELGQLIDINAGLDIAKQIVDFIGPGNIRDYLVLGVVVAALFAAIRPPTTPTTTT